MFKTMLESKFPVLFGSFCSKTGLPLTNGYANPFASANRDLLNMRKLVESGVAHTLDMIQIPHINPTTNQLATSNIFAKIDTIVTDINPDSKVYIYGGVVRSVLSFLYWHLINEHQKNPGNIQTKQILEEFLNKNETYHFQHVLGLGSDLDLLIDQKDSLEKNDFTTREVKKFIDQYQNSLPDEMQSFLSLYGDVKNYNYQVPRSSIQGGSPIDWLSFPITPRSGNSFREPQTHPGIVENFLQGRVTFHPVDKSESRPHTVSRIMRTFLDLPFLQLDSKSINLLHKEIKQLPKECDKKVFDTFKKGVRNTRYYPGFIHPVNRFAITESDAIALVLREYSKQNKTDRNMPLVPEVLGSQDVSNRSQDFDPGNLRRDGLLISFTEFTQTYTQNGYLYHGTSDSLNLLSMFRGTYFISNDSQGNAIYGSGFYCTRSTTEASNYSGSSPIKILTFKIHNSPNIRIMNLKSIQKETLENWCQLAKELGQDLHSYLFEKFSIDIIINDHVLIQNMNVISLPNSISQIHSDWIDTSLSKWSYWINENNQFLSEKDFKELYALTQLTLANWGINQDQTLKLKLFNILEKITVRNPEALKVIPKDIPNYESIALAAVQQSWEALQYVPTDLANYETIALAAIQQHWGALQYVPKNIIVKSKTIALAAVQQCGWALKYIPKDTPNYETIASIAVQQSWEALKYVPTDLANYETIASVAVHQSWKALQYVHTNIPNYETIASVAVQQSWEALQYVHTNIPNYETIASAAVQQNWYALQYVPKDTPNYNNITLARVQTKLFSLQYVPKDTPNYNNIALAAVQKDWGNLEYVPTGLANYETIASVAVQQSWEALQYVPDDIIAKNETIASAAMQQSWEALQYVPKNIANYETIASVAVQQSWKALQYVSKNIANYETIASAALQQSWYALEYVHTNIPNYETIALAAIQENWSALQYVPKYIPNYETIASAAVQQSWEALRYVSKNIANYETIALAAIQENWSALQYVHTNIPNYETIALAAVQQSWEALQYVPKYTANYETIALAAVQQNYNALQYVPNNIPNYKTIDSAAFSAAMQKHWQVLNFVPIRIANYKTIALAALQNLVLGKR